jgi:hypothetical protein
MLKIGEVIKGFCVDCRKEYTPINILRKVDNDLYELEKHYNCVVCRSQRRQLEKLRKQKEDIEGKILNLEWARFRSNSDLI